MPRQRALVERLGAPVVTTINGKGILPTDHPLLVGSLLPTAPVLDEMERRLIAEYEADMALALAAVTPDTRG
ncbi:MAG: hypothetical protein AAF675_21370, partial [Pseudomonadota bacterium]